MTTWTLKLTQAGDEPVVKTGLTREQTLVALTDLMYGTFDDVAEPAQAEAPREAPLPIAA